MSLIEKAAERLDKLPRETSAKNHSAQILATEPSPPENAAPTAAETVVKPRSESRSLEFNFDLLKANSFITPDTLNSHLGEEFRVIKRPILANVMNTASQIKNANLIMVTSALPGEGKSFTAINLAISIAMELDKTVLLIDADVAKPSLPGCLGIPEQDGLLDVLRGKYQNVGDAMLRTNIDKLTILTAGTRDLQATELLASLSMSKLLDEIAQRYSDRIVIFDAPPLLVTTEARALATGMGQIVFVVRAEETPKAAVQDALATIEECEVKLMVLNQARNIDKTAYGYGSYGYGN
jgi:exopolysaccharide/PEP-CTERM locus tyrosine autokinase